MPIDIDTPHAPRIPVIRRRRLGEIFIGALIKTEQRQIVRDDEPQFKPNGRPRMELVVHMLALPGTTMHAGIGDIENLPEPGDTIRAILKGGGFGAWIEADSALRPRQVGDIITLTSDWAQAYDANGAPAGERITDQGTLDAIPRGRTVGIYGSVAIARPTAEAAEWVTRAEEAYLADRTELAPATPTVDPAAVFGDTATPAAAPAQAAANPFAA